MPAGLWSEEFWLSFAGCLRRFWLHAKCNLGNRQLLNWIDLVLQPKRENVTVHLTNLMRSIPYNPINHQFHLKFWCSKTENPLHTNRFLFVSSDVSPLSLLHYIPPFESEHTFNIITEETPEYDCLTHLCAERVLTAFSSCTLFLHPSVFPSLYHLSGVSRVLEETWATCERSSFEFKNSTETFRRTHRRIKGRSAHKYLVIHTDTEGHT